MTEKSTKITGTGTVFATPGKVKSIHIKASSSAGSVVLKDGGAGGATLVDIETAALATPYNLRINNIQFSTDIHGTLTNVDSITVFYEDLS